MKQMLTHSQAGLNIVVEVSDSGDVRLLHFAPTAFVESFKDEEERKGHRLVELQCSGEDLGWGFGSSLSGNNPANRLTFTELRQSDTPQGRKWELVLADKDALRVTVHWQFYKDLPALQAWTQVENTGKETLGLEFVSSFVLHSVLKDGAGPWDTKGMLWVPHNGWTSELQWRAQNLAERGLTLAGAFSRVAFSNTGTWSTRTHIPMGVLENTAAGTALAFQIENQGSWHWEMAKGGKDCYLLLSGPCENPNGWWQRLAPGQGFTSVPVAVSAVQGGFAEAVHALNGYRRVMRRPSQDNVNLPVIFNDYMNCLWGQPTTEKLKPLIDAAAEVGCEYFCIDCGWYAEGPWFDFVGEWLPAAGRFPGGIHEPLDYIRAKGMVPGLWLELEVMGVQCPLADKVPDSWFFQRHGKRVQMRGRYQLDFRNPDVIKHADEVVDRLVKDYKVGYIKMDYNSDAGVGTERDADSFGDGLLRHNRAYLAWLDRVFERYPDLVIENCGSGGMRMDYALLSRHSIQSSSDQMDYRNYAAIAAASPAALTPEQCAIWSYPIREGDEEETIFNMVNAMLMRIHQSGHLAELSAARKALVKEGIAYYKGIRALIPQSRAFWPLGLPQWGDAWLCVGLEARGKRLLAVWRLKAGRDQVSLPLPDLKGRQLKVRCAYPQNKNAGARWNSAPGVLDVLLPQDFSARLFEIDPL